MLTYSLKQKDIRKKWYLLDANGLVLGRLASRISQILRGKHKTSYSPHLDCGDNVIVINAEKIKLTGNKSKKKLYYKHTGYPGGLKETKFLDILNGKNPDFIIRKAVERMMNSNALAKKQLGNLRVFKGESHNLEGQKPEKIDFGSLNRKNLVKAS
ncbi:MAG: 50S ribosomal protein L13 [Alphaproteobacteria bacterium MarineAlpha8_Bin1]|nr:MAG: 50S ribosomal protein L13 [Alphaproteobacteria bacterium MarineAlpha8_Bin1]|tara:strand:+ start:1679 stop:2146 length:468 start_codon:yes stop_codon:yes gene_type:complete